MTKSNELLIQKVQFITKIQQNLQFELQAHIRSSRKRRLVCCYSGHWMTFERSRSRYRVAELPEPAVSFFSKLKIKNLTFECYNVLNVLDIYSIPRERALIVCVGFGCSNASYLRHWSKTW